LSNQLTNEGANLHSLATAQHGDDGAPAAAAGGGLNFLHIVATARSNLKLIGIVISGTLAVAILISLLQTPRYTASATIQINNQTSRVLKSDQSTNDDEAAATGDTDRFLKTQVEVLRSRAIAQRVAQKLNLVNSPRLYLAEGSKPPVAGTPDNAVAQNVEQLLRKNLEVTLPRDSRVATIAFESNDAALSADVVNTYASEFIKADLQRKFNSSAYARDFLANQLTETKQRLEESERALNAYSREAGLIHMGNPTDHSANQAGNGSVTASTLLQLNQAANEAKGKRISAESRWRAINSGPLLNSTEVVSNGAITQLLVQKAGLESALAEDRARHLADYPTVKAKTDQIESINRQIQNAAGSIRNAIRNEYDAAVSAEKQLNEQVVALKGETLGEQDRSVRYGLLAREVDTNRQVYDGLLQRFKELNASAGISISNISVVDVAPMPLRPTSPNVAKNLVVGLLAGVVLAIVVVAIKDQFDDSIRIPEDVESKLGLALLGVIPKSTSSQPEADLADPKSSVAEAYNSLCGSLLYATRDGLPGVMLITSAQPSEGKTTTSIAVARGLARMGKSVILFDADLRRPTLHRMIDYDNGAGLSTLLTSQDSVLSVSHSGGQPNLSVVTSGPIPPSPTELLSNARVKEIISEARQHFDVVVIDSPPVLGLADAPLLSALVDGVIFVVEADRSRRGSLRGALRRLRGMRPVILGAALTKFDPLRSGNRYSSYYGYEYYQYQYSYGQKDA